MEFGPDAAMPISIPSVCLLIMSENDAVAREKDVFSSSLYVDESRHIWFCLGVKHGRSGSHLWCVAVFHFRFRCRFVAGLWYVITASNFQTSASMQRS